MASGRCSHLLNCFHKPTRRQTEWKNDHVSCIMYWYSLCHVKLMSCPLPLPDANASMTISTLCRCFDAILSD